MFRIALGLSSFKSKIMNIIGNKFLANFGMAKAILNVQSETLLTFIITEKDGKEMNEAETVEIKLTELRPQLYMITWTEKNGNTVTQIQDHGKEVVYNNWTLPGGEFVHANGTLRLVKQ
jgi:ABC-type lipoprotein release transport system permease subunit